MDILALAWPDAVAQGFSLQAAVGGCAGHFAGRDMAVVGKQDVDEPGRLVRVAVEYAVAVRIENRLGQFVDRIQIIAVSRRLGAEHRAERLVSRKILLQHM